MKRIKLCSLLLCLVFGVMAQGEKYDPTAILLLDRMTDVIGDLSACSYKTIASHDEFDPDYGLIKKFVNSEVYMVGPDKMVVNIRGPRGHLQCWYNGSQFAFFDYDENNYGIVPAPGTIIAMIDSVHKQYNMDFPAADFIYPAFTDDLIESSDRIAYVGTANINGRDCFQLSATGKITNTQIWVSNDAYNLPVKYVIVYHTQQGSPQYEVTFSEWQLNPDLPAAMFEFLPPPGSTRVRLMSTSE